MLNKISAPGGHGGSRTSVCKAAAGGSNAICARAASDNRRVPRVTARAAREEPEPLRAKC